MAFFRSAMRAPQALSQPVGFARLGPSLRVLYGKLIPFDVNAKVEEQTIVHYETLEERRAAMIAKGWSPASVTAACSEPPLNNTASTRVRSRRKSARWRVMALSAIA